MSTTQPHRIANVLVADPTITRTTELDGRVRLTLHWPESWPDVCLFSRDLLIEIVQQMNACRCSAMLPAPGPRRAPGEVVRNLSATFPAPEWDCQCRSVYVTTVDDWSIAHDFLPDGTVEYRTTGSDLPPHNWIAPAPVRRVTITAFELVDAQDGAPAAAMYGTWNDPAHYCPTDQWDIATELAELKIDGDAADYRWAPVRFERVEGEWVRQS